MSRTRQAEEQQKGKQIPMGEQGNKYKGNKSPKRGQRTENHRTK